MLIGKAKKFLTGHSGLGQAASLGAQRDFRPFFWISVSSLYGLLFEKRGRSFPV